MKIIFSEEIEKTVEDAKVRDRLVMGARCLESEVERLREVGGEIEQERDVVLAEVDQLRAERDLLLKQLAKAKDEMERDDKTLSLFDTYREAVDEIRADCENCGNGMAQDVLKVLDRLPRDNG